MVFFSFCHKMKTFLAVYVGFTLLCSLIAVTECETSNYGKASIVDSPVLETTMGTSMIANTSVFPNESEKIVPTDGTPKECNCGEGSVKCEYRNELKVCQCKNGFLQDLDGFCRECNCGPHGNCIFEQVSRFLRKACDCFMGYAEFGGYCVDCFCGVNGNCTISHRGLKMCKCEFGYGAVLGTCTPCGCGPEDGCSFDKETKRCQCLRGFEDVNGLCKDINECLIPDACPKYSTCFNFPGTYTCNCKKGFRRPPGEFNPQKDLCQDIDECLELDMPCLYESTTCVNEPGSYRCDCKQGYQPLVYPRPDQPAKYNDCIEDASNSKTIALAVGCICGAIIIMLLILVQFKGRRR